jgi:hypothetical protein
MSETGIYGIPFNKLEPVLYYGAAAPVANYPLLRKPSSVFKKEDLVLHLEGRGMYIEGTDNIIKGYNFPVTEAELCGTTTTLVKTISLSDTLKVVVLFDATNLVAYALTIASSGVWEAGSAVTVNAGATTDVSVCKISSTSFAVGYIDDVGDDYACVRIGTVSGTTITMGTEVEFTDAACTKNVGTAICMPRSTVLALTYVIDGDTFGYIKAATFSAAVIGTPGTAVVMKAATAVKYPASTSNDTGDITIAYQDDTASNDPLTVVCGTVSATGVVSMGTAVSFAGTAGAATSISIDKVTTDVVAIGWVDNSVVHAVIATISTTTPTKGTEKHLVTAASSIPELKVIDHNKIVVVYKEATTNYGAIISVARSSTNVLSITRTDYFALASSAAISVAPSTSREVTIAFADAGASSVGKVIVGQWDECLIDVRSSNASERYMVWAIPVIGRKKSA